MFDVSMQSCDRFTEVATNPGVSEADAEEAGMVFQRNCAEVLLKQHVKVRRISKSLTDGSSELSLLAVATFGWEGLYCNSTEVPTSSLPGTMQHTWGSCTT